MKGKLVKREDGTIAFEPTNEEIKRMREVFGDKEEVKNENKYNIKTRNEKTN